MLINRTHYIRCILIIIFFFIKNAYNPLTLDSIDNVQDAISSDAEMLTRDQSDDVPSNSELEDSFKQPLQQSRHHRNTSFTARSSECVAHLRSSRAIVRRRSSAPGGARAATPFNPELLFSMCYDQRISCLEVKVKEARHLPPGDAYVKTYLLPDRSKATKRKSRTKRSAGQPVFNELLSYHLPIDRLLGRTLQLSVWQADRLSRNALIGQLTIPLSSQTMTGCDLRWYPLQRKVNSTPFSFKKMFLPFQLWKSFFGLLHGKVSDNELVVNRGEICVALRFLPQRKSISERASSSDGAIVRGDLQVLVKEAFQLISTRDAEHVDTFVKWCGSFQINRNFKAQLICLFLCLCPVIFCPTIPSAVNEKPLLLDKHEIQYSINCLSTKNLR